MNGENGSCALIHSRKFPSQIGKSSQKSALVRKYGGCSSVFLTENSFADFHSFEIGRIVVSNAIAPMEVHGRQQVAASKNLDVAYL